MSSRRFGALVALVLCAVFLFPASRAAADTTVSVAPSLVELMTTGHADGVVELTVFNDGDEPFDVQALVEPYKGALDDLSAVGWFRVSPQSFHLAPGQLQKVKVELHVPGGLATGGRYAMVAFATGPQPSGSNGAGLAGQIGVPFLVTVRALGSLRKDADLERLLPVLDPTGQISFRALLSNTGNTHIVPQGEVEVLRADGSRIETVDLPETTAVLPGMKELIASGGALDLASDGRYRAKVAVRFADGPALTKEIAFSARPSVTLVGLNATERVDGGPTLHVDVRNNGDLGIVPRVNFTVRDADGKMVGTTAVPQPQLLWPGDEAEFVADFSRLGPGDYTLVALFRYGTQAPIMAETPFRIGRALPEISPDWGRAPSRPGAEKPLFGFVTGLVAALAVFLLATVGVVLAVLVTRRRRRPPKTPGHTGEPTAVAR